MRLNAFAGANSSWFFLFRILLLEQASHEAAAGIAATVEQFLQTATLGEFKSRLNMIQDFG